MSDNKNPFPHINQCLQDWFNFPKNKIYCQVATLQGQTSRVRTMSLYHLTGEGDIVLFTDTSSRKWEDLKNCPNAALCIFNDSHGQILAEGQAALYTSLTNTAIATFYWNNYLDSFWQNFYLSRASCVSHLTDKIPHTFGVIVFQSIFWDVLEINLNDFLQSLRKQYRKEGNIWLMKEIAPE